MILLPPCLSTCDISLNVILLPINLTFNVTSDIISYINTCDMFVLNMTILGFICLVVILDSIVIFDNITECLINLHRVIFVNILKHFVQS